MRVEKGRFGVRLREFCLPEAGKYLSVHKSIDATHHRHIYRSVSKMQQGLGAASTGRTPMKTVII